MGTRGLGGGERCRRDPREGNGRQCPTKQLKKEVDSPAARHGRFYGSGSLAFVWFDNFCGSLRGVARYQPTSMFFGLVIELLLIEITGIDRSSGMLGRPCACPVRSLALSGV